MNHVQGIQVKFCQRVLKGTFKFSCHNTVPHYWKDVCKCLKKYIKNPLYVLLISCVENNVLFYWCYAFELQNSNTSSSSEEEMVFKD